MIGIDTNVLLRLLTEDDTAQAAAVRRLLAPLDAVPEAVLINDIVLVETLWILKRLYGFDRAGQANVLGHLLSALTFRFEDREVLSRALALFTESSADFSDCLIAAKNTRWGCESTATFDRSMAALDGVAFIKA
jgi:predicted nucleic-acid-binding protein